MRISDWSSDVCSSDLLAEDPPRPRTVNRGITVSLHPARDAADDLFLLAIDRAVAAHGNRQQQIAVLGHDIAQPLDHLFGGHVAFLLETRAIVMPVADAGARLPRLGPQAIGKAAFDILHPRARSDRRHVGKACVSPGSYRWWA